MKLDYAGKIQKKEDGTYKIVANWNENILVEAESLTEAKNKFTKEVEKNGTDPSVVGFEMNF